MLVSFGMATEDTRYKTLEKSRSEASLDTTLA
jgi:hypothetical protein